MKVSKEFLGLIHRGIMLLPLAIILVGSASAQTCTAPPPGLVAWWPGDGNYQDIIGHNDGTAVGTVPFINGEVGQSFGFNGTSGYVNIPTSTGLPTSTWTVEFWFFLNTNTISQPFVDNANGSGSNFQIEFYLDPAGAGYGGLRIGHISTPDDTNSGVTPTAGVWHHLAAVHSSTAGETLYLDGNVIGANPRANVSELAIQPEFGRSQLHRAGEGTGFLNGMLDEVSMYNRALSASEIQAIFAAGTAGKCKAGLSAPTNLQVTQVGFSGNQVQLTWDYGNDLIDGFSIEGKLPSGGWVPLTSIAAPQARIIDMNAPNVPTFGTASYRIRAYQGSNSSDPSNVATAFQIMLESANCGLGWPTTNICTNLTLWPLYSGINNVIWADFMPDPTLTLNAAATILGYDHFNWISTISYLPPSVTEIKDWQGNPIPSPPFLDPPLGGYDYLRYDTQGNLWPSCSQIGPTMDFLPYYWNEQPSCVPGYSLSENVSPLGPSAKNLNFQDKPHSPQLGPVDYIQFVTSLVGVAAGGNSSTVLNTFVWSSNNHIAGVGGLADAGASGTGTGGIFNVAPVNPKDLPVSVRTLLMQAGVQGLTTAPKIDKDAPITTAFLSGTQGASAWYTGPVQVTLIATDIDGPSDIASTTYSVDGGSTGSYAGTFAVSGDGSHAIHFGSIDRAGNVETPRPSQAFKIDATPPTVTCSANPNTLWPPNGRSVTVTVSGTITDATSGVDLSSAKYAVADEYGQVQPSGSVAVGARGNYSFGLPLIAARNGNDADGRKYTIVMSGKDNAGNVGSCSAVVTVPHDQGQ